MSKITIFDIWPDFNPNYKPSFGEPMSKKDKENFERFFSKRKKQPQPSDKGLAGQQKLIK